MLVGAPHTVVTKSTSVLLCTSRSVTTLTSMMLGKGALCDNQESGYAYTLSCTSTVRYQSYHSGSCRLMSFDPVASRPPPWASTSITPCLRQLNRNMASCWLRPLLHCHRTGRDLLMTTAASVEVNIFSMPECHSENSLRNSDDNACRQEVVAHG